MDKKTNKSTKEKASSNPVESKKQNQKQPKLEKPTLVPAVKKQLIGDKKVMKQQEKRKEETQQVEKNIGEKKLMMQQKKLKKEELQQAENNIGNKKLMKQQEKLKAEELQLAEKKLEQKASNNSTKKKNKPKQNQETKKLKPDKVENVVETSTSEKSNNSPTRNTKQQPIHLNRNYQEKHESGTKNKQVLIDTKNQQESCDSILNNVAENWDSVNISDWNDSPGIQSQQNMDYSVDDSYNVSNIISQQSSDWSPSEAHVNKPEPNETNRRWEKNDSSSQNTDTRNYSSDQRSFNQRPDRKYATDYYNNKKIKGRMSEPNYQSRKDDYSNKFANKSFNYKEGQRQQNTRYRHPDALYQEFLDHLNNDMPINHGKLNEVKGNLFSAPEDYSLAHCVAEDMAMGAGIAKTFRKTFGNVANLLNQRQRTGGLAILKEEKRFIYYLVTKELSRGKPTQYTLWQSLQKLKEHIIVNNVSKLAIPQIGCGLDRLDWQNVTQMLEHIFKDVNINICVYILDENAESSTPEFDRRCFVTHAQMKLIDIEPGTGIVYFGTENSSMTEEISSLSTKYNIIPMYKRPKKLGEVLRLEDKEVIYGLIIRKTEEDDVDFEVVEKAIKTLRNMVRKDEYKYIGLQAFIDKKDKCLIYKIVAMMQFILNYVEIWVCWPDNIKEFCPQ